jgi:hypothetical protein
MPLLRVVIQLWHAAAAIGIGGKEIGRCGYRCRNASTCLWRSSGGIAFASNFETTIAVASYRTVGLLILKAIAWPRLSGKAG